MRHSLYNKPPTWLITASVCVCACVRASVRAKGLIRAWPTFWLPWSDWLIFLNQCLFTPIWIHYVYGSTVFPKSDISACLFNETLLRNSCDYWIFFKKRCIQWKVHIDLMRSALSSCSCSAAARVTSFPSSSVGCCLKPLAVMSQMVLNATTTRWYNANCYFTRQAGWGARAFGRRACKRNGLL